MFNKRRILKHGYVYFQKFGIGDWYFYLKYKELMIAISHWHSYRFSASFKIRRSGLLLYAGEVK